MRGPKGGNRDRIAERVPEHEGFVSRGYWHFLKTQGVLAHPLHDQVRFDAVMRNAAGAAR
jgi:hypothetical protein